MEEFLKNLNKLIRDDEFVKSFANAVGLEIEEVKKAIELVERNFWFDTMTEDLGIPMMARKLGILLGKNIPITTKRKVIEARYKNNGKISEELLQRIADTWRNGAIDIEFNNEIIVKFVGLGGIPSDIDKLKEEINIAKPAYLLVKYVYAFLTWNLFDSWDMSWDEFEGASKTFDEWEITIFKP